MVVKNIFKNVEYPKDRGSIEHIIKEYDKRLEHKLGLPISKKPSYIFHMFSIINMFYILSCSGISIFIRSLYVVPLISCTIYNILLLKKVRENNYNDKKLFYKLINFDVIHIFIYIYSGTFMYETVIFKKWTDENYLISFCIIVMLSAISSIMARMEAPKRFIENYKNKKSKLFTLSSLTIVIVQLLVSIAYFNKPYYLLLIGSSMFLVIMSGLMTYVLFIYNQYDKIQDLKKQINYIPNKK